MIQWTNDRPKGPTRKVLQWIKFKNSEFPAIGWWVEQARTFVVGDGLQGEVYSITHWAEITPPGTGIGRATWSTGDEAQYQTGAFTITETDGASEQ